MHSPGDILKALNILEALKEEINGIEGTGKVRELVQKLLNHDIPELEDMLKEAAKKPITLSNLAARDLKNYGIARKCLIILPEKVTQLTQGLTTKAEAEISDLHSRIMKIYTFVNMDYEPGSHMILDAILLALAEIISTEERSVAILPQMRIDEENPEDDDGVQISHPVLGYEFWLSNSVDCVVIEYEDVSDNKDRLLATGGSREDAFKISNSCLLLVKTRHQQNLLVSHIPEAVSQAIALLMTANLPEVRFCLSNGQAWMFFIMKLENETLTYYESAVHHLNREVLEDSVQPLRETVQLICEWLRPTTTDLFELE